MHSSAARSQGLSRRARFLQVHYLHGHLFAGAHVHAAGAEDKAREVESGPKHQALRGASLRRLLCDAPAVDGAKGAPAQALFKGVVHCQ